MANFIYKITVFSSPKCPHCHSAKEFLTKKGVDFEDIDVLADQNEAKRMVELSGQMSIPVILVDKFEKEGDKETKIEGESEIITGYSLEKLVDLVIKTQLT